MTINPKVQALLDLPGLNAVIVDGYVRVTFFAESHISLSELESSVDPSIQFASLHEAMKANIDKAFEHRLQLIAKL